MKMFDFKLDPVTGEEYYEVNLDGRQLLNSHLLNKGPSFTREERNVFNLMGCLPWGIETLQSQVDRALEMYRRKDDDLERYIFLMELLNRNATVFYRLLLDNLVEMIPIVYTPTVGQACLQMSHIQRRSRGLYIHPENIAAIDRIFGNVSLPDVRLIVVTDGERILGLGDLGSDGMGISIGKVCLYVAAGCLHPAVCMPMCIDVGTNNERLLNDPLYLGWKHPRLQGDEYYDFIERFVVAVRRNFPGALLQWEDFAKHHAFDLLARYRERILSFNDDIQGTGATGLAALMTAARIKGCGMKDLRYAIVGMGEAGSGISDNIRAAMVGEGLSDEEARRRIFPIDRQGLLVDDDPTLEPQQRPYALPRAVVAGWTLADPNRIDMMDVLRNAKPNVLIGVTARPGLFDDAVLGQMAANDPRPVILALSNPTSKVECTPDAV
ncbi:MAG TPA: oxaloacetate-decarboxylating malate dehydrogenase, partial [Myxococcota bacterium]|nr:oxaloacetate-decarboxylating malate dehydrogenase [Myxococcota bacterium]